MTGGMHRGGYRGPIGRIGGVGPVEGPNVIGRIRMIQRISALDAVHVPGTVGRSFQEILENKSWGTASVPQARGRHAEPVAERRPLPPTREELEEMLESAANEQGSFLSRLADVLKAGSGE
jgi:hypothetical protein